jgi:hypothetical protein
MKVRNISPLNFMHILDGADREEEAEEAEALS